MKLELLVVKLVLTITQARQIFIIFQKNNWRKF